MSATTHRLIALGFSCNSEGSLTRATELPITPPSSNPDCPSQVLTKDVPVNPSTNTSVRIFLPRRGFAADGTAKLPVIIFAHGGGFIILRAASTSCHDFCSTLAVQSVAIIVSVDYRLAPEHRLPAAYDDFMETIHWVRTADEEWLTKHADLSNCYLMGSSAGGNIVFHAALRAAAAELDPVNIRGLILHQPFFGGVQRTASEIRSSESITLSLSLSDVMWELSLPIGADRDHEYCNPMTETVVRGLDKIKDKGWKVTVTGCDGDTVFDRQMELVKAMKEKGISVGSKFVEGEYHGYDAIEPTKAGLLFAAVKEILQCPQST